MVIAIASAQRSSGGPVNANSACDSAVGVQPDRRVSPRYDTADRQLGREPLRLGGRLGRARTKDVGFPCVAGGMAHHALAL